METVALGNEDSKPELENLYLLNAAELNELLKADIGGTEIARDAAPPGKFTESGYYETPEFRFALDSGRIWFPGEKSSRYGAGGNFINVFILASGVHYDVKTLRPTNPGDFTRILEQIREYYRRKM